MAQSPIKQHEIQFNAIEFHWLFDLVDQQYLWAEQSTILHFIQLICEWNWENCLIVKCICGAEENKSTNSIFSSRSAGEERLSLFIWACRGAFGSLGPRSLPPQTKQATPTKTKEIHLNFLWFVVWLALLLRTAHSLFHLSCFVEWIVFASLLVFFRLLCGLVALAGGPAHNPQRRRRQEKQIQLHSNAASRFCPAQILQKNKTFIFLYYFPGPKTDLLL